MGYTARSNNARQSYVLYSPGTKALPRLLKWADDYALERMEREDRMRLQILLLHRYQVLLGINPTRVIRSRGSICPMPGLVQVS